MIDGLILLSLLIVLILYAYAITQSNIVLTVFLLGVLVIISLISVYRLFNT